MTSEAKSKSELVEVKSTSESRLFQIQHEWHIENFSFVGQKKSGEWLSSEPFSLGGLTWRIELFPYGQKGEATRYPNCTVVFITCCNLPENEELYVMCDFSIINHNVQSFGWQSLAVKKSKLTVADSAIGRNTMLVGNHFLDKNNGFLDEEDALTVKVHLKFVRDYAPELKVLQPPSSLTSDLSAMLEDGTFSDCTVVTRAGTRNVHKMVLAARSPVFRVMFQGDAFREGLDNSVEIDDFSAEAVDAMLMFMYSDKYPSKALAQEVLLCADKYQIRSLVDVCQYILASTLTVASACESLLLSDRLPHCASLRELCVDFLSERLDKICTTPDFKQLMVNAPDAAADVIQKGSNHKCLERRAASPPTSVSLAQFSPRKRPRTQLESHS